MNVKDRIGFVELQGVKIMVLVRKGKTGHWVSAYSRGTGPRLPGVERALKKMHGARDKLLNAKTVAI